MVKADRCSGLKLVKKKINSELQTDLLFAVVYVVGLEMSGAAVLGTERAAGKGG
jgi:hypothetical protein